MELHRIGIIGLGLIGGSIGLDLQAKGHEVCGLVHREITASRAQERGLAQIVSTDPTIIKDCSIVIVALPLQQLIEPTQELIDALPANAVITDVGSVKKPILNKWKNLHPKFIASHPMSGTIQTGVEAGQRELFKNKPWVATPDQTTDQEALKVVKNLAITLGSNWITTDADTHDQAVALISHLPVFISASLLQAVSQEQNNQVLDLAKAIASSGFKDTTRVGGGNPSLGVAMAMHNSKKILESLSAYRSSIDKFEEMISNKQWNKLQEELKKTQQQRPEYL